MNIIIHFEKIEDAVFTLKKLKIYILNYGGMYRDNTWKEYGNKLCIRLSPYGKSSFLFWCYADLSFYSRDRPNDKIIEYEEFYNLLLRHI